MKLSGFELYRYELPFVNPVYIHGHALNTRCGIIIHLTSDEGKEGLGETAPLPFRSEEDFETAVKQLKILHKKFFGAFLPSGIEKLTGIFGSWLDSYHLAPSVRFGFEMAVLNLIADTKHKQLNHLLSHNTSDQVNLTGLLSGTKDQVRVQVEKLFKEGFRSFKLKVGPNIPEEVEKVRMINEITAGKALLHIDANQAWTINQAVEFGNEAGLASVEYIEEPFKETQKTSDFFMKTTIPVALDESLTRLSLKEMSALQGMDILVLKPTILGGVEKIWKLINDAHRLGISTIISSSFESSIGLLALGNLASYASQHSFAGLDTLKYFKEDLLRNPLIIKNGKLDIHNRSIHMADVHKEKLTKIPS